MSRYVPDRIRRLVLQRAHKTCEYCLLHETQSYMGFEIDHVISLRHGGPSASENLAYSCLYCNQNKAADVGTIILSTETFTRFFNPRKDHWNDHFEILLFAYCCNLLEQFSYYYQVNSNRIHSRKSDFLAF